MRTQALIVSCSFSTAIGFARIDLIVCGVTDLSCDGVVARRRRRVGNIGETVEERKSDRKYISLLSASAAAFRSACAMETLDGVGGVVLESSLAVNAPGSSAMILHNKIHCSLALLLCSTARRGGHLEYFTRAFHHRHNRFPLIPRVNRLTNRLITSSPHRNGASTSTIYRISRTSLVIDSSTHRVQFSPNPPE